MNIKQYPELSDSLNEAYINVRENRCQLFPYAITLREYAKGCDTVVEFGRNLAHSTIALMAALPKRLITVDIQEIPRIPHLLKQLAADNNIAIDIRLESSLETVIPECDLLFIDSFHIYSHLKAELTMHHSKVKKWILLHDIVSCGNNGLNLDGFVFREGDGLLKAIHEFVNEHKDEWQIHEMLQDHFGLGILRRIK